MGISDAAGRDIVNTFDALNRLETSTDGIGLIERLRYDADSRVLSRENGRGEVTGFEYNALGHEILRTLPPNQSGARELEFEPGIHGEVLAETDANGNTTTHSYDGLGRRVLSTLPAVPAGPDSGNTRRWSYDRVGNLLSHTDAADRATTWRYSPRNQRIEQTDPSPPGHTQTWDYDVADNLQRHVDRRGIVHTQRHDGENRVIERTRDGLRIEALAYDGPGRVQKRTDARDEDTTYTYDPAGSVLTETRALGFVQRWTYWPWGSPKTHTDADGLVRSFEYDARQRLTKETDPAGAITTHGYDLADHRTRTTRPGAAEWTYAFDADGKLIEVESPEGHRTVYEHDAHGNRTVQRNAGGIVTRFAYDARHRVTAIDHPIGGDEGFAYNGEGELTAHTDRAGQRIEIERDGLGRITERRYTAAAPGDIHREVFALDGDGRPTTLSQYGAADGPQHVQRRYDGQGRLIEEDDRFNQRSTWTYDEAGNRLSLTDPAGTTTTAPDRLNRIARQTTAAGSTELSYSSAGRLQQITHPNGARSETRYDAAGRIERITHYQGSSEVARFEYTYDARGNRIEERRIDASGTQHTTYDYDRDDRLTGTTVTAPGGSVTETRYTLDDVGNRAREVVRRNGATVSDIAYTYQAHQRLTEARDSVSGVLTEYAYDARGHLVSETRNGQTTTYRPNAQDRLATLTLPGAPPVQIDYAYDSEGKRVERRTPTELTRFGWDGETLRRETNAANNVIEAHDWAAGRILSSRRLNDTRYAQHDALRSPIRWSQSTGAEQGQLRYDAWGETTETSPDLPRIAYTGHYREREGGSYYAQQRNYRPGLGRFNRIDPWSGNETNPITLNKYLYPNGNPLAYIDPDGLRSVSTMIDDAAEGCGPVSCAGWAMLYGAYHVGTLGFAGIHDPARDAYSAGEIDGTQYATHTAGALAITAVSATGVGSGARVVAGATTVVGRVGAGAAVGAATGGGLDAATQGLSIATGVQEGYDLNRTRNATLLGGALGGSVAGAGHLVQSRQQASALSAEAAARRVVRTPSDGAERLAVQQGKPIVVTENAESLDAAVFGPTIGKSEYRDWAAFNAEAYRRYQSYVDDAYDAAIAAESEGLLRGNKNTRIGDFVDRQSRDEFLDWLASEGISEGAESVIKVNRWLRDPAGTGNYVRPDIQLPGIIMDATVGRKPPGTLQVMKNALYSNGLPTTVVRPSQRSGSCTVLGCSDQ
ncbi:RHS repeat-associated core domain-containing protein [Aquimonas voraii]|uniref:RHS repeat-associated core domain-containing protein n=1 Tax=Aquimonas voraii TaxID=265719 RepID=A0A1G6YWU7_9GAMM|nr:RHS repeat-associated core domain-containing protein [Aquimonas voraii]SDD94543.1 RHS repeat-associated core domain-containing protein [Aquimonas voraii]